MSAEPEEIVVNFSINDTEQIKEGGWSNANWLLTIGTVLEEGAFQGVKGPVINYSRDVVEKIIQTAVNKPIHLFHRNREENKRDVGRIYGILAEDGKGKIKYVCWDEGSNNGINDGTYKLSLEGNIFAANRNGKRDATSGTISGVSLVEDQAVPGAINEQISTVALENGEDGDESQQSQYAANADPGIRFPQDAQLNEAQLSPCISLLQKNGYTLSKEEINMSTEENPGQEDAQETETNVEAAGTTPDVQPPQTPTLPVETPSETVEMVSLEEFNAVKEKMENMATLLEAASGRMDTLEGTDLESIQNKILGVSPKADFKILLEGARDIGEQKRMLNSHLAGLKSRDTPDVNLEGVDSENAIEKPDPVEMEKKYFKDYLGMDMEDNWFKEQPKGDEK